MGCVVSWAQAWCLPCKHVMPLTDTIQALHTLADSQWLLGVQVMRLLTPANVPEPPEEWEKAHQQLAEGLHRACRGDEALQEAYERVFDLRWYVDVQARLHINCFRCCPCASCLAASRTWQVAASGRWLCC